MQELGFESNVMPRANADLFLNLNYSLLSFFSRSLNRQAINSLGKNSIQLLVHELTVNNKKNIVDQLKFPDLSDKQYKTQKSLYNIIEDKENHQILISKPPEKKTFLTFWL